MSTSACRYMQVCILCISVASIECEAECRLGELLGAVTRLIASGADEAPQIRADLS
jgi:hypothetical protein